MELTSENVETVFMSCLFSDGEDTSNHIKAEGIASLVGFHPERLESQRENVKSMLEFLPNDFMKTHGGGMSFLNACTTKDGVQWTGLHQQMDKLFQLGIGLGLAKYLMPKEMWKSLPGGMPYIVVDI